MADTLITEEATITDDLVDFMDENPIEEIGNVIEDYDSVNKRIEDLRTQYRSKHNQLKQILKDDYKDQYEAPYKDTLDHIKYYIKKIKAQRKLLRDGADMEIQEMLSMKESKFLFLESEVKETTMKLELAFTVTEDEWKKETDIDISKRKSELTNQVKEMHLLTTTMKDMMDSGHGIKDASGSIYKQKQRYEALIILKNDYVKKLGEEFKGREIDQHKEFNKEKLNIRLPKFKGYNSDTDYYTFKSSFEKLHGSKPKSLLPDLLKNNFLEGQPLLLVKDTKDIDDIWKRLKESYGDCKIMLHKKLSQINSIEGLWKHNKDPEKTINGLSQIINLMKDLMYLAKEHNIENRLYYGDALEKIHGLMGDARYTRWLSLSYDTDYSDEEIRWKELQKFLEKEVKICQQKIITSAKIDPKRQNPPDPKDPKDKNLDKRDRKDKPSYYTNGKNNLCVICGAEDHVATNGPGGSKLVQYFVCQKFVEMTPAQRFSELMSKGLCFQCLFPGAKKDQGKHKDGHCQRDFTCKHPSHERFSRKKHILVCEDHKNDKQNKEVFDEYKRRCIARPNQVELPAYSKDLQLHHTFICQDYKNNINNNGKHDEANEDAIYMLQTIKVDGRNYSIFYDTGCREFVSRHDAILRLQSRAHEELRGPITLGGVGGLTTETPHGIFSVKLPLRSGGNALFTGACMNIITEKFPSYPLKGNVEQDIKNSFLRSGGKIDQLPKLMDEVGGDTDFMLGIKYLRYFPKKVFQLPSGLSIYESCFMNADGSFGVVGGPHEVFSQIERQYYGPQQGHFISSQYHLFKVGYHVDLDVDMLGYKEEHNTKEDSSMEHTDEEHEDMYQYNNSIQQRVKKFKEVEEAGSEIQYRCVTCRVCKDCKDHDHNEAISIKEEIEQDVINRSVTVDIEKRVTTATLPLMNDPVVKLCPNKNKAMQTYKQQLKRLSKNPHDKRSILKAEAKLQDMGFVAYVKDLPAETQQFLQEIRTIFRGGLFGRIRFRHPVDQYLMHHNLLAVVQV